MKQKRQAVQNAVEFKRRLLCVAVASAFGGAAYANPTGPQVVNGQVSFAVQGNALSVTNSPNAIINWQSFSIGHSETTRFLQQSASSAVLNRVTGIDPSIILGTLQSNGKVFLINPSGVLFGKGSRVDVAGLVASTLDMSNQDFLAGRLNFATGSINAGAVTNQGTITTPSGGSVILVAPQIENSGIINAPNGDVILAAGRSVRLGDTGAPNVLVEIQAPDTQAINVGEIVVGGGNASIYAGLIEQRGIVKADGAVMGENGKITFRATNSLNLESGSITSASGGAKGGTVSLEAPVFYQIGDVHADGATGGNVLIQAGNLLQSGAVTADGTQGMGGNVTVNATNFIQTQSALLSARGQTAGGKIVVNAGADQNGGLFSSGTFLTTGNQGGEINLLGHDIVLLGATADASGKAGGGTILVGGDYQGKNPAIANADSTWINYSTTLRADAGTAGAGGKVVVWSENDTRFAGYISARGGANSGDGGLIEVSGKENLMFAGMADASAANGKSGTVLLDPKNIIIDSAAGGLSSFQLFDPHPGANEQFGQQTVVLPNDNVVVTDPNDSFAASSAGAVYLFNGGTGALISALTGSKDNDSVGSGGITQLFTSGNYVVSSPNWNGTAGAVTWGSGTVGVNGVVSDANSLVGSTPGDFVGSNIFQLFKTGNYLVLSSNWTNAETSAPNAGAVTWVDGATGNIAGSTSRGGEVSATNSLVGIATNDSIGSGGIRELAVTGNYLVLSPTWTNGGAGTNVGAVTWGSGTSGASGVVSAANSLVGSTPGDAIGSNDVIELSSGNYLVFSPNWANGAATLAGAVTFGSGAEGVKGEVSATNSLVGSAAGDGVGGSGVFLLPSGNYLVLSPNWANGAATAAGAVTFGSGTIGVSGAVSAANSLVGTTASDSVGSNGITILSNGNYVVKSPFWTNFETEAPAAGAATFGSGDTGVFGAVSSANSLVGTTTGDLVSFGVFGSGGVTELANGNYVVSEINWHNGGAERAGAVTWVDGTNGHIAGSDSPGGAVSAANSLVGTTRFDDVGNRITTLTNGNYVMSSQFWADNRGAVTWIDGTNGNIAGTSSPGGTVSSGNSLVGSAGRPFGDQIGHSVTALSNGNYVVESGQWHSGAGQVGAVTWVNGLNGNVGGGTTPGGFVSSSNSLVGSTDGDLVGMTGASFQFLSGIVQLSNNNYLVLSSRWHNGAANSFAGAVTLIDGSDGKVVATGTTGATVSATNSLVGSARNDGVGSGGVVQLANGNYVVSSPGWNKLGNIDAPGMGAVTFGTPTSGVVGVVSATNSLVGTTNSDSVGNFGVTALSNGNYVVNSAFWNGQAGAVTWGSGTDGVKGTVSSENSLVGGTAGDRVGFNGITPLFITGNYVVNSSNWNGTAGAVTWGSGTAGVKGTVSSDNSLVGSKAEDRVGLNGTTELFATGNYLVNSSNWNGNAGAVTWGSGTAGVSGEVSAGNSLVGNTAGDFVGSNGILELFPSGNYLVFSPHWANGAAANAGAITFGSGTTGISGAVSAANSLVGTHADDQIGSTPAYQLSNGNFLVSSPIADNGTLVDAGLVQVVSFGAGGGAPASGQTFESNPGQDVTIAPSAITAITNTGTAVTLQANNDITLRSASDVVTSAGGEGGGITLEAGRSILLNSSITTDNGNLVLTANHPGADSENRDEGAGGITMASGTTLNAGGGTVTLTVGTGVAGAESGNLVVDKIIAANVELHQNGNTDASSILRAASTSLIQATNLTMEVIRDSGTSGSIGTAANPILTSGVSRLNTLVSGSGETAVTNSNGVGGPVLALQEMSSNGGNIRLINDTDISLIDSCPIIDCSHTGQITSFGGNIYLQSTAGSIIGNGNINASGDFFGASGGTINLNAGADIRILGSINASGEVGLSFGGVAEPGGNGGTVNANAPNGSVALGRVDLHGGTGTDEFVEADGVAGPGGRGGALNVSASSGVSAVLVNAAGGAGGQASIRTAPSGGGGGMVNITGTGATATISGSYNVSGGPGGPSSFGTGSSTASVGPGGDGGSVFISAFPSSVLNHVNPGTPGSVTLSGVILDVGGGLGGLGSANGAQGTVHLQSGDGGITQTAPLVVNTTDFRIVSSGSVILNNQSNVIPGVWGEIGGDLWVTSFGPIQLGLVSPRDFDGIGSLSAGGNIRVESVAGSETTTPLASCIGDSCIHFVDQITVTAGGNIEFYTNEIDDHGTVTSGQADSNFVRFAPWTPGTSLSVNLIDTLDYVTPHVQLGNPDGVISGATWGHITVNTDTTFFNEANKSFEIYAGAIDIDGNLGFLNFDGSTPLPVSFTGKAAGAINVGTNIARRFYTTIYVADGKNLTLQAGQGTSGGDLTIGGNSGTALVVGAFDGNSTNPGSMLLSGTNVIFNSSGMPNDFGSVNGTHVTVNGSGDQTIAARDTVQLVQTSGPGIWVQTTDGVQTVTTTNPLSSPTPSLLISAESAASGSVTLGTFGGDQHIQVAGGVSLIGGSGSDTHASIDSGGNQTVDAAWIRVRATGGSSFAHLYSHADQSITTTGAGPAAWGIALVNTGSTDNALIGNVGAQTLHAMNSNGIVVGGGSVGESAIGGGTSQSITIEGTGANLLDVLASERPVGVYANGLQTIVAGQPGELGGVQVVGGSLDAATADIYGGAGQHITTVGDMLLRGGTNPVGRPSAVINSNGPQTISANSITVTAVTGPVSSGFFAPDGPQTITTTGAGPNGYGITLENLGGKGIDQGGFFTSAFIDNRSGAQTIDVSNSAGILISASGGDAAGIFGEGTSQSVTIHGIDSENKLVIAGGMGTAQLFSNGPQTVKAGLAGEAGGITLHGGTADKAFAVIGNNNGSQNISTSGNLSLTGGTAPGPIIPDLANPPTDCTLVSACAVVVAHGGQQTIEANAVSITGGTAGTENLATIRGDAGQDITVGSGGLTMQGGTGTGLRNFAFIENYSGDQILRFNEGDPLSLTGGTLGIKHFAAIMAMGDSTSQQILGNPAIALMGGASGGGDGSGFFATFTGNNAYIGTDPLGSVATSQKIEAQSIHLLGGTGPNNAAIDNFRSGGTQTITVVGDVRLEGGSGASALAEFLSFGDQTVHANSIQLIGAAGGGLAAIHTQGGDQHITTSGSGPNGWGIELVNNGSAGGVFIETSGAQTIAATDGGGILLDSDGGSVAIRGGGMYQETVPGSGIFQFVANAEGQSIVVDGAGANAIELRGGSALASIEGGNQSITAGTGTNSGSIALQGGASHFGDAWIFAHAGTQSIKTTGQLSLIAGSAPDNEQPLFHCGSGGSCVLIGALEQGSAPTTLLQDVTAGNVVVKGGSGGAYNEAALFSHGTQRVTITGSGGILIQGGAGAGNYADISADRSGYDQNIDFGGGDFQVIGGTSGGRSFGNVYAGGNQTITGTGNIVISGGVLPGQGDPARCFDCSNSTVNSGNIVTESAVYSFAEIVGNGGGNPLASQNITANSISITARPGQSSTGIFAPTGTQRIHTIGTAENGYGITIENQGATGPDQNGFGAAAYLTTRTGTQNIDVDSGGILIKGTGGLAVIDSEGPSQTITIASGALDLEAAGGSAVISFAFGESQKISADSISLQGGYRNGAIAVIEAFNGTQEITANGTLSLTAGNARGPAEPDPDEPPALFGAISGSATIISRNGLQTIDASGISLTGGGGNVDGDASENFANIRSDAGQHIIVGAEGLTLKGGPGTGVHNFAIIENYEGEQKIEFADGAALEITGGDNGVRNFAGIFGGGPISYQYTVLANTPLETDPITRTTAGTTSQKILGNPVITLNGGATGGGGDGTEDQGHSRGNTGFIVAQTGTQEINAASITMTGGGGVGENEVTIATWTPGQLQTITSAGAISLTGGSALYATANIISAGAQTITAGGIDLTGGSASGFDVFENSIGNASASIFASGGTQSLTITNGGSVTITGGTIGTKNFAEISSAEEHDQTIDFTGISGAMTLTGGTSGTDNSARIESGGNQTITGTIDISLIGGAGTGANANLNAELGTQTIGTSANRVNSLTLQGGSGLDAIAAMTAVTQEIWVSGATTLTGGAGDGALAAIGSDHLPAEITLNTGTLAMTAGSGGIGSEDNPYPAFALIGAVNGQNANVNIQASGDVTLTSASTNPSRIGSDTGGGVVVVNSGGGSVTLSDSLVTISGDSVAVSGSSGVAVGGTLTARDGGITVTTGSGNIDLRSAGLSSTGNIDLSTTGGAVVVGSGMSVSIDTGNVNVTAPELVLATDFTLQQSGWSLNLLAPSMTISGLNGTETLTNVGLFTFSNTAIGVRFDNQGTVNVANGTLSLNNGGSGAYTLNAGTSLDFGAGFYNVTSITGAGGVNVSGGSVSATTYDIPGITTVSAGALDIEGTGSFGTLKVQGGFLGGEGSVTASVLNLSGGSLNGSGNLTVNSNFTQSGGNVGGGYQQLLLAVQGDALVKQQSYSAQDTLALAASGSITIDGQSLSAPNLILFSGGGLTLRSSSSAASSANATTSLNVNAPSLVLDGANGPAKLQSAGTMDLIVGSANVTGGAFAASIDPTTLRLAATGNIVLTGGSGADANATISGDNVIVSGANIFLNGGSGARSSAVIEATPGNATVTADNHISLIPGTGANADAIIVAPPGNLTVTAQTCTGCIVLDADPLLDPGTNQGLFGSSVVLGGGIATSELSPIEVPNSIVYAASLADTGGNANTEYTKEEEENKGEGENESKPKKALPACAM